MNMDEEFMMWRREWQSQPAVPIDLIRQVERQTAHMRTLRVAEIVVTLVMGGGVLAAAIVHPVLDRISWLLLAAGTWLFIAVGWIISLRSTRDVWDATKLTTADYVSLHVRRLRGQLERIRLGTLMVVFFSVCFLIFVAGALVHELANRGVRLAPRDFGVFMIVGGLVNAFVVLGQMGKRRRVQAELDRMLEIERRLKGPKP